MLLYLYICLNVTFCLINIKL